MKKKRSLCAALLAGALAACGLKPEEYAFYAVSGQGDARSVRLLPGG